jgi:hypothetical protein
MKTIRKGIIIVKVKGCSCNKVYYLSIVLLPLIQIIKVRGRKYITPLSHIRNISNPHRVGDLK